MSLSQSACPCARQQGALVAMIVSQCSIITVELLYNTYLVLWPARARFLKIVSVRMSLCLCVCYVCPLPRLLITSGMMWCDMNPI